MRGWSDVRRVRKFWAPKAPEEGLKILENFCQNDNFFGKNGQIGEGLKILGVAKPPGGLKVLGKF